MASIKRWKLKKIFTGFKRRCGCGKQKATESFDPKPKSIKGSSNSWEGYNAISSKDFQEMDDPKLMQGGAINDYDDDDERVPETVSWCSKISNNLAIVKDSNDPYGDFGRSMLEMIVEKEIYCEDDLQELLTCFLNLNSPHLHEIILQAFADIWNIGVLPEGTTERDGVKGGAAL